MDQYNYSTTQIENGTVHDKISGDISVFDANKFQFFSNSINNLKPNSSVRILSIGYSQYPNDYLFTKKRMDNTYFIGYVTSGKGTFNNFPVAGGQGFFIAPNVEYTISCDSDDPWKLYWITFSGNEVDYYLKRANFSIDYPYFDSSAYLQSIVYMLDKALYGDHTECNFDFHLLSIFFELLGYHSKYNNVIKLKGSRKNDYVYSTMEYINENYNKNVTIENLASRLHINRQYLHRLFKENTGMSPQAFLIKCRIAAACNFLINRNDMSIENISNAVGYKDYSQFSKLFKHHTGISPNEYRKANTKH